MHHFSPLSGSSCESLHLVGLPLAHGQLHPLLQCVETEWHCGLVVVVQVCVSIEDSEGIIVVTLVQLFSTGNKLCIHPEFGYKENDSMNKTHHCTCIIVTTYTCTSTCVHTSPHHPRLNMQWLTCQFQVASWHCPSACFSPVCAWLPL